MIVPDKLQEMNEYLRKQFPSLKKEVNGQRAAFFDGPGGYQVPKRVVEAMENYLYENNANIHGAFPTSKKTDEMLKNSRKSFAQFFNCSWDEVSFGANMTTLNFALALALEKKLEPGNDILITQMDHEANCGPWETIARKNEGVNLKEVKIDTDKLVLDGKDFRKKLSGSTKIVAVNYSSNALGTTTDVEEICSAAEDVGAYTVIDAVHYAAHGPIDVKKIDPDFLLCSAYKFFGPHIGILFSRKEVMEGLNTLKVRPQKSYPPYKMETGTLNHEGIAGAREALEFVADIGKRFGEVSESGDLRSQIVYGLEVFDRYEKILADFLKEELNGLDNLKVFAPGKNQPSTSTVSFVHRRRNAREVAEYLAEKGLFVWDGDFYATRIVEKLGLKDRGGLVRIGVSPYNTEEETRRLFKAIKSLE